MTAARIERALVSLAVEIVAAAAIRKGQREHVGIGVVAAGGQLALRRVASGAEERHPGAGASEATGADLAAEVAVGVPEDDVERAVGPRPRQQIEGELVVERDDLAAPATGAVGCEAHG